MDIRRFASYVVVEYSKLDVHKDSVLSLGDFTKQEPYREIFDCIHLLCIFYKDIISTVNTSTLEVHSILSSKKEFMTYLLSRCLKLSEDSPTFFEFLLVCVYLGKITELLHAKYKCCKLLKVIADCLESIYCRKYCNYFKENDDFSGLADFCRKLNRCPISFEFEGQECFQLLVELETEVNKKVKIFRDLTDVDENIELNELEVSFLINKPFLDPLGVNHDAEFLIWMQGLNEDPPETEVEHWEALSEVVKTGFLCQHCLARCYQYHGYLAREYPE